MKAIVRLLIGGSIAVLLNTCAPPADDTQIQPTPPAYDWTVQLSFTNTNLHDVYFMNPNLGWAVGDSLTVLATTSAGMQWPQVPTTVTAIRNISAVHFADTQTGWFTSTGTSTAPQGHVLVSKGGGAYPTDQATADHSLNTVFFLNNQTGWAAGDSSILLQTVNAGLNWTTSSIGKGERILDIKFVNATMGWASAWNGKIYRTKDGANWTKEDLGITADLNAIHFVDTLHGWVCGKENAIYRRTTDSNNKPVWQKVVISTVSTAQTWNDIFFINSQIGWVVGNGAKIYKTIDGGVTWNQETILITNNLNGIHMVDATHGFVVGDSGTILMYTP